MFGRHSFRCFSRYSALRAVEKADPKMLVELRKSTGYAISKCVDALKMHDNDLTRATQWLSERAHAEGWLKAQKLSSRATSQGLIGVSVSEDNSKAVMLELNCETDFVARTNEFADLVKLLTKAYLSSHSAISLAGPDSSHLQRELLSSEQIPKLPYVDDNSTFGDKIALAIGKFGENMSLKRAMKLSMSQSTGVRLFAFAHPSSGVSPLGGASCDQMVMAAKHAAVVAVTLTQPGQALDESIIKKLCVQIIGSKAEALGTTEQIQKFLATEGEALNAEAEKAKEAAKAKQISEEASVKESNPSDDAPEENSETEEDEIFEEEDRNAHLSAAEKMIKQKFLLKQDWFFDEENELTVEEVLEEAGIEVVHFAKMTVGRDGDS